MKRCPACKRMKTIFHKHHKFHNTKWARNVYGKLIDHCLNIDVVCADCNSSHSGIGLTHWSEREFCEALGIEMRSKHGIYSARA